MGNSIYAPFSPPISNKVFTGKGDGHNIGHIALLIATLILWPSLKIHDVKCNWILSGNFSPWIISSGSREEFLCVPLKAAPATWVIWPSGAISEIRTTQLARFALADTWSFARGLPRISIGSTSTSESYTKLFLSIGRWSDGILPHHIVGPPPSKPMEGMFSNVCLSFTPEIFDNLWFAWAYQVWVSILLIGQPSSHRQNPGMLSRESSGGW